MNLTEIIEALVHGSSADDEGHRLLADTSKEKWKQIRESEFFKAMIEEVEETADRFLESSIKSLRYSDFKRFDETGSREKYQKEYFERRARLCAAAIMFLVYEEEHYKEALEDIIWAICDEYTWCLPAHLKGKSLDIVNEAHDRFDDKGRVLSFYRSHDRQVDLFNAETGFALAEILYLTKDRLAPQVSHRARKLIEQRILEPFCEINRAFDWETYTHNWAAVCGGSVGAAAIYLIEDDRTLAPIIRRVLDTMDCFLKGYQEDGACTEGMTYWTYGFGFFVYFSELLRERTAGAIDLMKQEKVKSIALFQQKGYLTGNETVSFSDAPLFADFRLGLTCRLEDRFPEVEMPDISCRAGFHGDHCYRWPHIIRDYLWGHNAVSKKSTGKDSCFMDQSQWLVARTVIEGKEVCLAAKGGHNDEPHNHNDIGSFIFHINGETLLTDLGAGEYTKQYFGPERYSFLCNSSRGHSVPIIDGGCQKEGMEARAEEVRCTVGAERDVLSMDIAKAYGNNNLYSLKRNFEFRKQVNEVMVIEDKFVFRSVPKAITERFVSLFEPILTENGYVVLKGENESVDIFYDPTVCSFNTSAEEYSRHDATKGKVYFLDFILLEEALKEEVSVSFKMNYSI